MLANVPNTFKRSGTFWQRWKRKNTALPWRERFVQNVEVLQRVARPGTRNRSAYGEKLKQVGTEVLGTKGVVIDILRDGKGKMLVRLNTDSPLPINQFRTRREDSRKRRSRGSVNSDTRSKTASVQSADENAGDFASIIAIHAGIFAGCCAAAAIPALASLATRRRVFCAALYLMATANEGTSPDSTTIKEEV